MERDGTGRDGMKQDETKWDEMRDEQEERGHFEKEGWRREAETEKPKVKPADATVGWPAIASRQYQQTEA